MRDPPQDNGRLLGALVNEHVNFVVVGGIAAVLHGSSYSTKDLDIVVNLAHEETARRLHRALLKAHARFAVGRHAPFPGTAQAMAEFNNLYVMTDHGRLDVLFRAPPMPDAERVLATAVNIETYGLPLRVLDLDTLIHVKKTVARPKDLLVATELEAIRERLGTTR
jgi:hypothetical protein